MKNRKEESTGHFRKVTLGKPGTTDDIVKYLKKNGFNFVGEEITQKNLPLEPHEIENIQIEIIDPGCRFSEEEGIELLEAAGLERPTEEHALRFAEQCGSTTIGGKPFIVFLHEPWIDQYWNPRVLFIHREPNYLGLNLDYASFGFNEKCMLAGIRSHG